MLFLYFSKTFVLNLTVNTPTQGIPEIKFNAITWRPREKLNQFEWYNIRIEQTMRLEDDKFEYKIYLNNKNVYETINTKPEVYEGLTAYASRQKFQII